MGLRLARFMPMRENGALQLPPVLARAQRAFSQTCGVAQADGSCKSLLEVVHRFAAFQRRVFASDTPCSERRVLVIRESYSDAVGVGHLHNGFVRLLTLALAMGRSLVFSACTSEADPWAVRGSVENGKQDCSAFDQLTLRRLRLDHASGCPRLRPASVKADWHTGPEFHRCEASGCGRMRSRSTAAART